MLAALSNEADIFGVPRLQRPGNTVLEYFREAEDGIKRRA